MPDVWQRNEGRGGPSPMTVKIMDQGPEISLPIKTSGVIRGAIEVSAEIERTLSGRARAMSQTRRELPARGSRAGGPRSGGHGFHTTSASAPGNTRGQDS